VSGVDWSIVLDVGVGVGVFFVGVGALIAGMALARTLDRVNVTLGVVDGQMESLGKPIGDTLDHVSGIADTADQTLARLRGVVEILENIAATAAGVAAGLRRMVTGRNSGGEA